MGEKLYQPFLKNFEGKLSLDEEDPNAYSWSIENLFTTQDDKARLFCLNCISKRLKMTDGSNIDLSLIDFFISNFIVKPQIFNDERFQKPEFYSLIYVIQANLVHIIYPKIIPDIFDICSEASIFTESEVHLFQFLYEFDKTMSNDCRLFWYEKKLYETGAERNIISYLKNSQLAIFQTLKIAENASEDKNNYNNYNEININNENDENRADINHRFINLWISMVAWLNQSIVIEDPDLILLALKCLTDYKSRYPIITFFENLLPRLHVPDPKSVWDVNTHHPRHIFEIANQVFDYLINSNCFQIIIDHCIQANDSETAAAISFIIGKRSHIIYKTNNLNFRNAALSFLIKLIPIASLHEGYALNGLSYLIDESQKESIYETLFNESQKIIENADSHHADVILSSYIQIYFILDQPIDIFLDNLGAKNEINRTNILLKAMKQLFSRPSISSEVSQSLDYFLFIFSSAEQNNPIFTEMYIIFIGIVEQNFDRIETKAAIKIKSTILNWTMGLLLPIQQSIAKAVSMMVHKMKNDIFAGIKTDFLSLSLSWIKSGNTDLINAISVLFRNMKENDQRTVITEFIGHLARNEKNEKNIDSAFNLFSIYRGPIDDTIKSLFHFIYDEIAYQLSDKYIIVTVKILGFESYHFVYDYISSSKNISFLIPISEIVTAGQNLTYESEPVSKFGDLIINFLQIYNNDDFYYQKNEIFKIYREVLNNSVIFFVPLFEWLTEEKFNFLVDLFLKALSKLAMSPASIGTFLSFIRNSGSDDLKKKTLDITKDLLLDSSSMDKAVPTGIKKVAKEIMKFHIFMFRYNEVQTLEIFANIEKSANLSTYMEIMNPALSKEEQSTKMDDYLSIFGIEFDHFSIYQNFPHCCLRNGIHRM